MFENRKVMNRIYKNNIPTPYNLDQMIKAIISLEDPEVICYYLKANPNIPTNYVKILIDALILYNDPNNIKWFNYILNITRKMPLKTQEVISASIDSIRNKVEMYNAYHRGIDF